MAGSPGMCPAAAPRLLRNMELAGPFAASCGPRPLGAGAGRPPRVANYRDVAVLGAIDGSCRRAAALLGHEAAFLALCRSLRCREQPAMLPKAAPSQASLRRPLPQGSAKPPMPRRNSGAQAQSRGRSTSVGASRSRSKSVSAAARADSTTRSGIKSLPRANRTVRTAKK